MTVRNWLTSLKEKVVFISPDGVSYNLHDPAGKSVLNMSGWGLPTPDIADSRGPFQHGTNPLTIRIPPRTVTVDIRHNGCSRRDYWGLRTGLLDILRHSRTNVNNPTPGALRWYRADGTIRQIDVFAIQGPDFPQPDNAWDMFGYTDTIRFFANNPIVYDPTQVLNQFSGLGCTIAQTLQFPTLFGTTSDLIFGGTSCVAINTLTVNYVGTWPEYPRITVVGPATIFKIVHQQTGLFIRLDYTIPTGESVVFDLRYGVKTVTLGSDPDTSLMGYISDDSSLGAFAIEPHPIVTGGTNTFEVTIENGDGNTRVNFQYYTRYEGV